MGLTRWWPGEKNDIFYFLDALSKEKICNCSMIGIIIAPLSLLGNNHHINQTQFLIWEGTKVQPKLETS